jgi:hypothetical protein
MWRKLRTSSALVIILASAACGGSSSSPGPSSPTTPTQPSPAANRAPSITSVTVTPAFGISGLTTISMSATANDADGDNVSYEWQFGGSSATGPSVPTTITGDGPVAIRLTVRDGRGGEATDSRSVVIGTMTGRWAFTPAGGSSCGRFGWTVPPIMTLSQFGPVVTGDLITPAAWCNVPAGQTGRLDPASPARIDADGNFTGARLKIGSFLDSFLTGTMDPTGRTITGTSRSTSGSTVGFVMTKL